MAAIRNILTLFLLATASAASFADPITDGALNPYKAGWFSNVIAGKTLTCPEVCERMAKTGAEFEAAPGESLKKAFVCKVPVGQEGRTTTYLYGNQFDSRPACYTTDTSLRGRYSERLLCLCVEAARG
jgi:hypothetical protein